MADEVKAVVAALAMAAAGPASGEPARKSLEGSFPIVELRQYTLVEGADHCWESVPTREYAIGETVEFIVDRAGHRSGGST